MDKAGRRVHRPHTGLCKTDLQSEKKSVISTVDIICLKDLK